MYFMERQPKNRPHLGNYHFLLLIFFFFTSANSSVVGRKTGASRTPSKAHFRFSIFDFLVEGRFFFFFDVMGTSSMASAFGVRPVFFLLLARVVVEFCSWRLSGDVLPFNFLFYLFFQENNTKKPTGVCNTGRNPQILNSCCLSL